jgi:DNA-binding NarL/FixJ family response regulator
MQNATPRITVAIADNERLFQKSLSMLVNSFQLFEVVTTADNGEKLLDALKQLEKFPDVILLDVNMPVKDGIETAKEIRDTYPTAKMIALSVKDDDQTIISMIRSGCCAYLLKDMDPDDLKTALLEVHEKGYYNGDMYNIKSRQLLRKAMEKPLSINEKEKTFLQLSSTDMTYKQIAAKMHLSERTIDGYREALFEKFSVQSRVGMVLEGIRQKIISFS